MQYLLKCLVFVSWVRIEGAISIHRDRHNREIWKYEHYICHIRYTNRKCASAETCPARNITTEFRLATEQKIMSVLFSFARHAVNLWFQRDIALAAVVRFSWKQSLWYNWFVCNAVDQSLDTSLRRLLVLPCIIFDYLFKRQLWIIYSFRCSLFQHIVFDFPLSFRTEFQYNEQTWWKINNAWRIESHRVLFALTSPSFIDIRVSKVTLSVILTSSHHETWLLWNFENVRAMRSPFWRKVVSLRSRYILAALTFNLWRDFVKRLLQL